MFELAQLFLGDPTQLLIILGVLVLILIWGPSKIPELARAVGRARREFDDASRGITQLTSTSIQPTASNPLVDTTRRPKRINIEGNSREQISGE